MAEDSENKLYHEKSFQQVRTGFISLSIRQLLLDAVVPFDLYIKSNDRFVLYRSANLPLTPDVRTRLSQVSIDRVYVPRQYWDQVNSYFETNLRAVLNSPDTTVQEKANLLYQTSTEIMRRVFEEPEDPELTSKIQLMVDTTQRFLTGGIYHALVSLLNIASHDYYTYTHCIKVCMYSLSLGQRVGFGALELDELGKGAILHDIGKTRVDQSIIKKPGPLEADEWRAMQQHPAHAADILEGQEIPPDALLAIVQHHEKFDGSGYLEGVSESVIHPYSRIVAIADIFDAITTNRSYSGALTYYEGLRFMSDKLRGKLDGKLLKEFILLLGQR